MVGRILSVAALVLVGGLTLVAFQNCSSSALPDDIANFNRVNDTPSEKPEIAVSPIALEVGRTVTASLSLRNFKVSHRVTWSVTPNDGMVSPFAGELEIAANQETASIALTSLARAGSGNKFYTLSISEATSAFDRVMATVSVSDPTPEASLSVGYFASCAAINGSAKCWGFNQYGELGVNDFASRNAPSVIQGLPAGPVSKVAHGYQTSCAIVNGALYCWGYNGFGGLGDGSTSNSRSPRLVSGMESGVSDVAIGQYHTCAVKAMKLYCWGRNNFGQLGLGDLTQRSAAQEVTGMGMGVTAVAAGQEATCAIALGAVKCFGRNDNRQLGDGTTTNRTRPVAVTGAGDGVTSIAISNNHACAVVNGGVRCWGNNGNGQLGDGTLVNKSAATAIPSLMAGATQVVAGEQYSCAVVNSGVQCWGLNSYGNLGDGSTSRRLNPVPVNGLVTGVLKISAGAGGYHNCAVVGQGAVHCWGRNNNGQLGDGTNVQRSSGGSPINF